MRLLLRQYKIIAVTVIVCLLPAGAAVAFQTPEYRASTLVYVDVEPPSGASFYALNQATRVAQNRTITFKELVTTGYILNGVVQKLALDVTADDLASHVTALSALDTSIVEVTVVWSEPTMTARIANAIAAEMISQLPPQGIGPSSLTLKQAQPAVVPRSPSAPNTALILGLALLGGLLLGCAIVLIRQGFVRRIYSTDQVKALSNAPILGVVTPGHTTEITNIANIAKTIVSAPGFSGVRTLAVISTRPRAEKSEVSRLLSETLSVEHSIVIVDSTATLANRESVEDPGSIDVALVVVVLGQDSTPEFSKMMAQLELLGLTVGGLILMKPAMTRGRARRISTDAH